MQLRKQQKNIGSIEIEGRSMDMQMHEIYSEQIAQQLIQKSIYSVTRGSDF